MKTSSWLRSFRNRSAKTRAAARPAPHTTRPRLAVETLEDRSVPAAVLAWGDMSSYAELTNDPSTALTRDHAADMAADSVGNRYVLGISLGTDSTPPVYHLAKYDAADNSLAWVQTFSHPNFTGNGAVAVDVTGNVYVALPTYLGNGNWGPVEIMKLDSTGAVQQTYTESRGTADSVDTTHVIDLATDAAGAVYYTAAGYTVKLESREAGLVEVNDYGVGGSALAVSPDGNRVYVTGRFSGREVDFDPTRSYADNRDILSTVSRARDTNYDVFVLELTRNATTSALEFAWAGRVGGPSWDTAEDIVLSDDGVYVLGAYPAAEDHTNTSTDFDPGVGRYSLPVRDRGEFLTGGMFLLKLDTNNQFEWVKGLVGNGLSGDSDSGRGRLATDAQGSVYVSDVFEGTWCDFDVEHSYPGDADRMAGTEGSFINNLFVAKYSAGGAFRWAATVTGTGYKKPGGLAVTDGGVHVLSTVARDTLTVTPGGAQFAADPSGDLFLLTFTQTADPVQVYVKNVIKAEGNSGTTAFTFVLLLSDPVDYPVTINYATANGTAAAGSDYAAASGSVTFQPGETQKTVTVLVTGDGTNETDETFALDLVSLTPGVDAALRAWATVANDDAAGGKKK